MTPDNFEKMIFRIFEVDMIILINVIIAFLISFLYHIVRGKD